jgi:hypothetical protein
VSEDSFLDNLQDIRNKLLVNDPDTAHDTSLLLPIPTTRSKFLWLACYDVCEGVCFLFLPI